MDKIVLYVAFWHLVETALTAALHDGLERLGERKLQVSGGFARLMHVAIASEPHVMAMGMPKARAIRSNASGQL